MRIEAADASGEEAQGLLADYFAYLAATFPAGFDPDAGSTTSDPAEMSPPHGVFLLLREEDGTAVGCGGVKLLDDGQPQGGRAHIRRAEIKRMYLRPSTRGRGLGALLLDALEDAARDLGATEGVLDTNGTLDAALALYRLHGWREVPAYNDNPYATHWFAKEL